MDVLQPIVEVGASPCDELLPLEDLDITSPDFLWLLEGGADLSGELPLLPDAAPAPTATATPTWGPAVVTTGADASPLIHSSSSASSAALLALVAPHAPAQPASPPLVLPPPALALLALPGGRAPSVSCSDAGCSPSPSLAAAASVPSSPDTSCLPSSSSDTSVAPRPARARATRSSAAQQRPQSQQPSPQASQPSSSSQQQQQQQPPGAKPLTKQQLAALKRKAPEVDWRAIEDPEERRKQRRLAKNRITAARSRERKKEQLAGMEGRVAELEAENARLRALLGGLQAENGGLKQQLASLTRGAAAAPATSPGACPEPAVLECVAILHLAAGLLALCERACLGALSISACAGLCRQGARAAAPLTAPPAAAGSSCAALAGGSVCAVRRAAQQPHLSSSCRHTWLGDGWRQACSAAAAAA